MKKLRFFLVSSAVALSIGTVVVAMDDSPSGTAPVGDHWVDNLGTGVTALGFDDNSSTDCTSDTFLAGDYDLWHFVVNQASDSETTLSWNSDNSVWADPSSVTVVDVTDQYGPRTAGDGTKQLWIATTPAGATLMSAYLDYTGSAGRENLSHTCGRSSTPGITIDPTISYDMTWDWTLDKRVVWDVNATGGYDLGYTIEANRSSTPRVIPGSLHVTDGVIVNPPGLEVTALNVSFTQGTYTQACSVDLVTLHYDCELDVSKISIDSATGRPTGSGTLSAIATYSGGTLTDSLGVTFEGVDPGNVYAETASILDDYATPGNATDDLSTTESTLGYTVTWKPSGAACVERTNTATLDIDDPAPGMVDPTDSVTVKWCPPMPGLTIGYWGNKTGALLVVAQFSALKAAYPNVFALISNLTTSSAVRNFFQTATCTGDCKSMFVAQFLAAAMNALNPDFASQGVMVNSVCRTVSELLTMANAGATGAAKTYYESYKTIFDSINNSRQVTCLTVTD